MNLRSISPAVLLCSVAIFADRPVSAAADATIGGVEEAKLSEVEELARLNDFFVGHLPLIRQFLVALESGDVETLQAITTDDVKYGSYRSNVFVEFGIEDLKTFISACKFRNSVSSNQVAISVEYNCPTDQLAKVVFNFRERRIRRVLFGNISRPTIIIPDKAS